MKKIDLISCVFFSVLCLGVFNGTPFYYAQKLQETKMIHLLGRMCIIKIKCGEVYDDETIFSYRSFLHDAGDMHISVPDSL